MRELIIRLVINTISLYAAGQMINGLNVGSWRVALLGAIVFSILNMIIRPIIRLISLPITVFSLGLFSFVINGFILALTAFFSPISISGFGAAIGGAILIGFINWFLGIIFLKSDKKKH